VRRKHSKAVRRAYLYAKLFGKERLVKITQREINNKIGGLFMGAAISTCAFLLLAYEWNSKFLVALAFIIALTGACTNFNIKFK
jgi:hypothetical protein